MQSQSVVVGAMMQLGAKGMKKPRQSVTSRDVASLAGVSQATVSRAFTPGASLAPTTRDRVLKAADQLNYIPNSIASSLITARTNTIAVIIGDTDNPFYVHVLKAFINALQARGQQALTFTITDGATSDDVILKVLRYRVDAIILTAAEISTRMIALCEERGIPAILFNRYIPGHPIPAVRCDNAGGGGTMAKVLHGAGARRFTILKGDPLGTTSRDRVAGFKDAIWALGLQPSSITEVEGNSTYDGAYAAIRALYVENKAPLPDAIFAVNDIMAMAAIDVLHFELGVSIPGDVMVGGFDNIPESARSPYKLTTLLQPIDQMVEEALGLLDTGADSQALGNIPERVVTSELIWRSTIPGDTPSGL